MARRSAFLAAGGFERRFFLGAEEELLAIDLVTLGWRLVYAPHVVVAHLPSPRRDRRGRSRLVARNHLWCTWMRRPARAALAETWRSIRSIRDTAVLRGVVEAFLGARWALRRRRPVSPDVEHAIRRVGDAARGAPRPGKTVSTPPSRQPMGRAAAYGRGNDRSGPRFHPP